MQAQMEAPPDMQCKDKFLLQSVIMDERATNKDITPEMVARFCTSLVSAEIYRFEVV